MKKYLLPPEGDFYKANLHCHSTVSDGRLTPEELKKIYKEKGYSVLAFTDHEVMISHADLNDEEFITLNGYEIAIDEPGDTDFALRKTLHMCFIALEPDNLKQVCSHREKYWFANGVYYKDQVQFCDDTNFEREYTPENINEMIRLGREHGFFVTYNHPTWSCEGYEQYMRYENFHAMEISNSGCAQWGHAEYNPRVYDDMLRGGKRLYCVSTDDNHNKLGLEAKNSNRWESGRGWVMIKADKLDYRTITSAMEAGNFYASQGPEIHELWVEDGMLHIKTSVAERITMSTGNRRISYAIAEDDKGISEATLKIFPDCKYIRITVTDYAGRHANTNAYFIDEIL